MKFLLTMILLTLHGILLGTPANAITLVPINTELRCLDLFIQINIASSPALFVSRFSPLQQEKIIEAINRLGQSVTGASLLADASQGPAIVIVGTDAHATKIHVTSDGKIEANYEYIDSTPPILLTTTFGHEIAHIDQKRRGLSDLPESTPLGLIAEASALSLEARIFIELTANSDISALIEFPEVVRIISYLSYPAATLQAWVASKYSWAHDDFTNVGLWEPLAQEYWWNRRREESLWRNNNSLVIHQAWLQLPMATRLYLEQVSRSGDNWLEEGIAPYDSQQADPGFLAFMEALARVPIGAKVTVPPEFNEAELFILANSFLGKYDSSQRVFLVEQSYLTAAP